MDNFAVHLPPVLDWLTDFLRRFISILGELISNHPEWVLNLILILLMAGLKLFFHCERGLRNLFLQLKNVIFSNGLGKEKISSASFAPAYGADVNGNVILRQGWTYIHNYVWILVWFLLLATVTAMILADYNPLFYSRYSSEGHLLLLSLFFFLETAWYLDQKREIREDSVGGEAVFSTDGGKFLSLWEAYGTMFPERLIIKKAPFHKTIDDTYPTIPQESDASFEYQLIDLVKKNIFSSKQPPVIPRQKTALLDAFRGRDLLLIEPVFNFINPVVFSLMQYHYLKRHHILVLLPSVYEQTGRKEVEDWIIRGFKIPCFSEIELDNQELGKECFDNKGRIQLASINEVLDQVHSSKSNNWFHKLSLVVAPYGPQSFHRNSFQAAAFCNFLADFCSVSPQYIFLAIENRSGEESSMRDFLNIRPREYSFSGLIDAVNSYLIWKEEGEPPFQQRVLWNDGANFLGHEPLLALPAIQAGITSIRMNGCSGNIWKENMEELNKLSPSLEINNSVTISHFPALQEIGEREVIITSDTNYNVVSALQVGLNQGNREVLQLVVAQPYLLRDYFCSNMNFFLDNQAVSSLLLSPRPIKSRASVASTLAARLQSNWVREEVIEEYLNTIDDNDRDLSVKERLVKLFDDIFKVDVIARSLLQVKEIFIFNEDKKHFYKTHQFFMQTNILVDSPFPSTTACFNVKDGSEVIAKISVDQFYQNYLPDQIHGFADEPYKISEVDFDHKIVHVSHTPDAGMPPHYRSILEVDIKRGVPCSKKIIEQLQNITIERQLVEGEITISTKGYHSFTSEWHYLSTFPLNDNFVPLRQYPFGRYLRLSIRKEKREEDSCEVFSCGQARSLAFLLTEMLPTMFPQTWRSLLICTPSYGKEELDDVWTGEHPFSLLPKLTTDEETEGSFVLYFIEDARWDLGMIKAISERWKNLFSLVEDYIIWSLKEEKRTDFLKLGQETLSADFELQELQKSLSLLLEADKSRLKEQREQYAQRDVIDVALDKVCDFCGETFSENVSFDTLNDGRERCPECKKNAVENKVALEKIYKQARKALMSAFSIKWRMNINVELASAETIAKIQGAVFRPTANFDPRAVGLANGYSDPAKIYIENGHPAHMVFATCIHELTHCWQFAELDMEKIDKILQEGHAVWCEVFFLQMRGIGEDYIKHIKDREDIYGQGFRKVERILIENGETNPFQYFLSKFPKEIAGKTV